MDQEFGVGLGLAGGFDVLGVDVGVDVASVSLERQSAPKLFERYGVNATATYVFRPDGHVLARCKGIDAEFAAAVIRSTLVGGSSGVAPPPGRTDEQLERDRLYDEYAALVDEACESERSNVLARVVARLTERLKTA